MTDTDHTMSIEDPSTKDSDSAPSDQSFGIQFVVQRPTSGRRASQESGVSSRRSLCHTASGLTASEFPASFSDDETALLDDGAEDQRGWGKEKRSRSLSGTLGQAAKSATATLLRTASHSPIGLKVTQYKDRKEEKRLKEEGQREANERDPAWRHITYGHGYNYPKSQT